MHARFLRPALAVLCGVALSWATAARAAVMVLANGDHLTGKVIKREGGKIYFHSDILGDLVAPENAVTIIEKPPPSTPPESLAGLPPAPTAPARPAAQAQAAATLGPQLPALPPPVPTPPPVSPPQVKIVSKLAAKAAVVTPPRPKWTVKLEAGYDNQLTNIRTVNASVQGQAEETVGLDDYLFSTKYLYDSSAGLANSDSFDSSFRWRYTLSDALFAQTVTEYSWDRIQLIDDDAQQTAGLGYKLFQSLRQTVDVGGGVTGQYLEATGIQKGFDYFGNLFQDFTYKINGRYTFTQDASVMYSPAERSRYGIAPGTTEIAEGSETNYAYKFHSALEGKITDHLSLNLHFEYDFNNVVLDPATRAEERITTTLGYAF